MLTLPGDGRVSVAAKVSERDAKRNLGERPSRGLSRAHNARTIEHTTQWGVIPRASCLAVLHSVALRPRGALRAGAVQTSLNMALRVRTQSRI